jgi:hypothetical protein
VAAHAQRVPRLEAAPRRSLTPRAPRRGCCREIAAQAHPTQDVSPRPTPLATHRRLPHALLRSASSRSYRPAPPCPTHRESAPWFRLLSIRVRRILIRRFRQYSEQLRVIHKRTGASMRAPCSARGRACPSSGAPDPVDGGPGHFRGWH